MSEPQALRRLSPLAKLWLAGEVTATYRITRRLMAANDLPAALRSLRALPQRRGNGALTQHEGLRLGRAVQRTLRVLPADSRCLSQSLVLTGMLAQRGVSSVLVIGVRPGDTFGAHAWVELDGLPLLPPMLDHFERLTDL